jgi:hypothetical protein
MILENNKIKKDAELTEWQRQLLKEAYEYNKRNEENAGPCSLSSERIICCALNAKTGLSDQSQDADCPFFIDSLCKVNYCENVISQLKEWYEYNFPESEKKEEKNKFENVKHEPIKEEEISKQLEKENNIAPDYNIEEALKKTSDELKKKESNIPEDIKKVNKKLDKALEEVSKKIDIKEVLKNIEKENKTDLTYDKLVNLTEKELDEEISNLREKIHEKMTEKDIKIRNILSLQNKLKEM